MITVVSNADFAFREEIQKLTNQGHIVTYMHITKAKLVAHLIKNATKSLTHCPECNTIAAKLWVNRKNKWVPVGCLCKKCGYIEFSKLKKEEISNG